MDIEEKLGNLIAQKKQVKLEINDYESVLVEKKQLLYNIDGAIQFANLLKEEDKPKKKEKKDA